MINDLKLFATDMDGTFLRADRTFDHGRLQNVLEQFKENNWLFAAASGRSLLALQETFEEYLDQMAFVAENGGVVARGKEIIFTAQFTLAQIQELAGFLETMPDGPGHNFLVSGLKGGYTLSDVDQEFFDFAKIYYPNIQKVEALDQIEDTLLKISTNFPAASIRECEDWLNSHAPYVHATTSGFVSIDIIPAGINKATGLGHLLEQEGWSTQNLAAFGDQLNDFEMLQYAGTAYAMDNAVDEIKVIVDHVIGHHDESAVLGELERILDLGKK